MLGCLIYHPACASKEGGLFLYGAVTPPVQEGKLVGSLTGGPATAGGLEDCLRYAAETTTTSLTDADGQLETESLPTLESFFEIRHERNDNAAGDFFV